MKKTCLVSISLLLATVTSVTLAEPLSADVAKKPAFYMALSQMAPSEASTAFLIEQYQDLRCGKPSSIDQIKEQTLAFTPAMVDLAAGKYDEAKRLLKSIPCN